jgi:hypothetical protein
MEALSLTVGIVSFSGGRRKMLTEAQESEIARQVKANPTKSKQSIRLGLNETKGWNISEAQMYNCTAALKR